MQGKKRNAEFVRQSIDIEKNQLNINDSKVEKQNSLSYNQKPKEKDADIQKISGENKQDRKRFLPTKEESAKRRTEEQTLLKKINKAVDQEFTALGQFYTWLRLEVEDLGLDPGNLNKGSLMKALGGETGSLLWEGFQVAIGRDVD